MRVVQMSLVAGLLFCLSATQMVWADEVHLKNQDRLSGHIVEESANTLTLKTEAAGTLTLQKALVARVVRDAEAKPEPPVLASSTPLPAGRAWKKSFELGVSVATGNTEEEQYRSAFVMNGKTDHDEWTAKAFGALSRSEDALTSQRYSGLLRYGRSFGRTFAWYWFARTEAEHDRFANIDYRFTPSAGVGYWFSDTEAWKAMAEVGFGVERTVFRDSTASRTDAVVIPRFFAETKLFKAAVLTQDLTVFPNLEDTGEYRLKSETSLVNPLSDQLKLKLSVLDEYLSNPAAGTKKNDLQLISSLVWDF